MFPEDGKWYRGEVMQILKEYILVRFLDFGLNTNLNNSRHCLRRWMKNCRIMFSIKWFASLFRSAVSVRELNCFWRYTYQRIFGHAEGFRQHEHVLTFLSVCVCTGFIYPSDRRVYVSRIQKRGLFRHRLDYGFALFEVISHFEQIHLWSCRIFGGILLFGSWIFLMLWTRCFLLLKSPLRNTMVIIFARVVSKLSLSVLLHPPFANDSVMIPFQIPCYPLICPSYLWLGPRLRIFCGIVLFEGRGMIESSSSWNPLCLISFRVLFVHFLDRVAHFAVGGRIKKTLLM